MNNPNAPCEHGRQRRKCEICELTETYERIEQLEECLRNVLQRCFEIQFEDHVIVDVVNFANEIFHVALEADDRKDYYAPQSVS